MGSHSPHWHSVNLEIWSSPIRRNCSRLVKVEVHSSRDNELQPCSHSKMKAWKFRSRLPRLTNTPYLKAGIPWKLSNARMVGCLSCWQMDKLPGAAQKLSHNWWYAK